MKRARLALFVFACLLLTGCSTLEKNDELNMHIRNNENEEAKAIIDSGYRVNKVHPIIDYFTSTFLEGDILEYTPLYTACECGNTELIHYLLENGADPNVTNRGLEYPLEIYLRTNYWLDASVVNEMIEAGVDVNKGEYFDPLFALVHQYNRIEDPVYKEILQDEAIALLDAGANFQNTKENADFTGYTILHYVACSNDVDFMKKLLTYEAAKQYINYSAEGNGETPLSLAEEFEADEMIELITDFINE